ncbi:ribonuclease 2-5A domain-containing protein [Hirsutella rhossiliensis]|uniref:non-specific serine/threonine protein kinase n=1 Tax=Hirsutella rhossiliensis TaxID=111463 RepID=A0A9P8SHC1_9HYPO|nr:ribonuclease 2-5A domain-containing protein [Hirsutella rhossiliensis]KAH0962686.1 ribonuclease 2-5A domain-containing protein [Hirsutella rhossiliensis]
MLRRPPVDARGSSQQHKLLLALAVFLLPWLQLADAQQQHQHATPSSVFPQHKSNNGGSHPSSADSAALRDWAATQLHALKADANKKPSSAHEQLIDHPRQPVDRDDYTHKPSKKKKSKRKHLFIPDDASALATLAPAQSVRAPRPPRHQRPSSVPASGLAPQQIARSLEDWEVQDFVLLATVDGDLYASDRKTGKERWHLEVDQPMVETTHHRANNSVLDDDYSPVDHYIWAVEPNRDGGVYVWVPSPDSRPRATGFTMKRLVEELAPYAGEEPPVVYTGDKKTTMITLDAATGRVVKWFGSTGSHINEAESCLRPNALYNKDARECSSTGTITLGRTEYTVGIQRRDGRPIATLKYAEWSPNNYDNDLFQQHHVSLDSRYITSQHDGKIYAFDYARAGHAAPVFSHKFSAPVVRVFDVCRPWDAAAESNPELVVLPQPTMPSQDEGIARMRSNSLFLNQTEGGSWYALSGRQYPLIIDAPLAQATNPGWWDMASAWDSMNEAKITKALVGMHSIDSIRNDSPQPPTLPRGTITDGSEDLDDDSNLPVLPDGEADEATIINKVKGLPQSAANSVVDFIKNPILFLLFFAALVYNEKKLRRSYHRWRSSGNLRDTFLYLTSDPSAEKDRGLQVDAAREASRKSHKNDEDQPAQAKQALDGSAEARQPGKTEVSDATTDAQAEHSAAESKAESGAQNSPADPSSPGTAPERKKKAHRGRRGGVKHRKGRALEASQSRGDEAAPTTVEEAVNNAKKLGDRPSLEPDVMTVANDMQAVTGPIIRMGNIEVNTEVQLGTGSNGTLVFAGRFDGREVAVKRMLIQFYDIASQETRLLRESDDHPNVIRYHSQQIRDGFLYIALERCAASLADVVERPHALRELANAGRTDLPGVLYQITNGISHLHALRIVHRDLKPQNILVNMGKDGKPRMLVSDFGLCKKLEGGQSSFGATTGRAAGTSGWRAPELLLDDDARDAGVVDVSTHSGSGSVLVGDSGMPHGRRATRAIDIFSLGLVFFYVLTNGSHPFDCGDRYMREVNIRKGSYNLRPLDSLGDFAHEAKDLIGSMLDADPKKRPSARDIMSHPFFWSAKKRLSFLCDVSDHFEKEPRDPPSSALVELERHAPQVTKGDFLRLLPRDFVDSLGKQRKYTGSRLLDLLRALRNKRNHYEDMADALKRAVGPLPEGYLGFWAVRFPMLLLVCWNVVYNVQWEETDRFRDYYEPAGL